MQTPQGVMGVFSMPVDEPFDVSALRRDPARLMLALDTIQDPGNLGTIIRVADWFGIDTVLAVRMRRPISSARKWCSRPWALWRV